MSPPVTVVVPTRNRRQVLGATLGTILGQRPVVPHVIVVDDASDDDTAAHLRADYGERVEVIEQTCAGGAAAARNAGLAAVPTPWVAFCDDDDLWAPTKLAEQLEALDAHGARWSATGAVCIDEDGRIIEAQRLGAEGELLPRLLRRNEVPGGGSAVLAETELVRAVGGFATDQRSSEDWDLWIRLAAAGPIAYVDRPLVAYRVWAGGKSRQAERMATAFDAIVERYGHLVDEHGVRPDKVGHQRWLAKQQLRSGDRLGAARRFAAVGDRRRALAALVLPDLLDRVGTARQRASLPEQWVRDAEGWLAALPSSQGRAAGQGVGA